MSVHELEGFLSLKYAAWQNGAVIFMHALPKAVKGIEAWTSYWRWTCILKNKS